MKDLKFNLQGYAKPTTKAELSALLIEALRLADEIGQQWIAIGALCEAKAAKLREFA